MRYGGTFEVNAAFVVSATIHEPEGEVTVKERFGTLPRALYRALELRNTSRPVGGPGRRSVIFVDRQRRGSARDLHLALAATGRTWGIQESSTEAQELLGAELFRQVGPTSEHKGSALPPGFEGFDEDVFESNAGKPTPEQARVLQRLIETGALLERRHGGFWVTTGTREVPSATGRDMVPEWSTTVQTVRAMEKRGWLRRSNIDLEEWKDPRELTEAGRAALTEPTRRRYSVNGNSIAAAREIRRKFHDKDPEHETEVPWDWPTELQEIGTCEAVMYASAKWQKNPHKIIDYKHVAEGPQRILVRPGFVRDHRGSKALKVIGPRHELNDMPDAFAVLDKILGVQVRLYEGTDENPRLPTGEHGYYQIDIPGAHLGAAKHPETGETFLIVYTSDGVHCLIVGSQLGVEKDGIVG